MLVLMCIQEVLVMDRRQADDSLLHNLGLNCLMLRSVTHTIICVHYNKSKGGGEPE